MTRPIRAGILGNVLAVLVLVAFMGCATPKATRREGTSLEGYKKVYLAEIQNDFRAVHPRVLSRLQRCGFDVVQMRADRPLDSQGSGFVITPQGHLLTCAHVVGTESNATVWVQGTRHVYRVLNTDTNLDIALLELQGSGEFRPIRFSGAVKPSMGDDVFTLGFPLVEVLGTSARLNKGMISSTVGMGDDPNHMQVSVQVQPGNSGGPLLNSQSEVTGMMVGTLNPLRVLNHTGGNLPQNVNFALKNGPILDFLAKANISLPPAAASAVATGFDSTKDSVALVRAGLVHEEELKQPALMCRYVYQSLWDVWYRFRVFHVEFYDFKSGDLLLKAGQYQDDVFSNEDAVIDRTFVEIHSNFFPTLPNPFKTKNSTSTRKSR